MKEKITQLNIQPQAGVIGIFSRLNYKPWYAIAEFVDNSTQSFYSNENELKKYGIKELNVDIEYDFEKAILTIKDDAYGMEIKDFHRAIKIDSIPETQGGRNEFGMGLKTAASWFGNMWSVESSQLGSKNRYYTEINIDELRSKNLNSIDIINVDCDEKEHSTTIIINNITKKIDGGRTKGKIIKLLESMYRRDINSGKINITFNGENLKFEKYECLEFREKIWKKELDFNFEFDNKQHHVTGFVGILKNGGFGKAGFALFRRNRVVIGGEDQNYKPLNIFSQIQSQISLRLFGELNLDDFDINQAKDGFVWDNGLEDEFVKHLKSNIKEYIDIAKISNQDRTREEGFSQNASQEVQEDVKKALQNVNNTTGNNVSSAEMSKMKTAEISDFEIFKNYLTENNMGPEIVLEDIAREYSVKIDQVTTRIVKVVWTIVDRQYWIDVKQKEDKIEILININHPFFKPYSEVLDFKKVLEKFVISFVIAEEQAKLAADKNGYVIANAIRSNMNKILSKMMEEQ